MRRQGMRHLLHPSCLLPQCLRANARLPSQMHLCAYTKKRQPGRVLPQTKSRKVEENEQFCLTVLFDQCASSNMIIQKAYCLALISVTRGFIVSLATPPPTYFQYPQLEQRLSIQADQVSQLDKGVPGYKCEARRMKYRSRDGGVGWQEDRVCSVLAKALL